MLFQKMGAGKRLGGVGTLKALPLQWADEKSRSKCWRKEPVVIARTYRGFSLGPLGPLHAYAQYGCQIISKILETKRHY